MLVQRSRQDRLKKLLSSSKSEKRILIPDVFWTMFTVLYSNKHKLEEKKRKKEKEKAQLMDKYTILIIASSNKAFSWAILPFRKDKMIRFLKKLGLMWNNTNLTGGCLQYLKPVDFASACAVFYDLLMEPKKKPYIPERKRSSNKLMKFRYAF
ncbi:conserved hypothetical protein [Ricinus communis]|uniref:Uncharacterized protein n=1 Tax=Ricinus communis TaxID=3988 RepID=B9T177_RICCO|nr:conserved hypothetical protein [Ricinus communis]